MTLANRITVLRIVLIPVFGVLFLEQGNDPLMKKAMLAVFSLAIFTDMLDGLMARIRKERTPLGTFLDPLADKLLLTASFVLLTYRGDIPLWAFVVIFSRDLIIVLGWTIVYILTSSSKIEPRASGKFTTFLQMSAVIALLFPVPIPFANWIVRAMVLATVVSAVDYILVGSRNLEPVPR